jgi:hypothetical protein
MRTFKRQVAEILNSIAKLLNPPSKSRDANRTRTQIDARHTLPKAQWHAEDTNALSFARETAGIFRDV